MNTKKVIHLKARHQKKLRDGRVRAWESSYCNKSWHDFVKLEIEEFLAVSKIIPDTMCPRCMNKVKKKKFDVNPGDYDAEQGLYLLASTEL